MWSFRRLAVRRESAGVSRCCFPHASWRGRPPLPPRAPGNSQDGDLGCRVRRRQARSKTALSDPEDTRRRPDGSGWCGSRRNRRSCIPARPRTRLLVGACPRPSCPPASGSDDSALGSAIVSPTYAFAVTAITRFAARRSAELRMPPVNRAASPQVTAAAVAHAAPVVLSPVSGLERRNGNRKQETFAPISQGRLRAAHS